MSCFSYANKASVGLPDGTVYEDGVIVSVFWSYPDAVTWAQSIDLNTAPEPLRAMAEGILTLANGGGD
jgi:hypothetical protein